jgi:hypothetical protein
MLLMIPVPIPLGRSHVQTVTKFGSSSAEVTRVGSMVASAGIRCPARVGVGSYPGSGVRAVIGLLGSCP